MKLEEHENYKKKYNELLKIHQNLLKTLENPPENSEKIPELTKDEIKFRDNPTLIVVPNEPNESGSMLFFWKRPWIYHISSPITIDEVREIARKRPFLERKTRIYMENLAHKITQSNGLSENDIIIMLKALCNTYDITEYIMCPAYEGKIIIDGHMVASISEFYGDFPELLKYRKFEECLAMYKNCKMSYLHLNKFIYFPKGNNYEGIAYQLSSNNKILGEYMNKIMIKRELEE